VRFPRQAYLDEDVDRLFPPDVAHAIRYREVAPTPTDDELFADARAMPEGIRCEVSDLRARQRSLGGPAAGTFYTPLEITNDGPVCLLLAGDLVLWGGRPAQALARLFPAGVRGVLQLRTGGTRQFFVAVPNGRCSYSAQGGLLPLGLSGWDDEQPTVTVAGAGVPVGLPCRRVSLISAGRPAGPSR
jgi:hypothetical protein